MVRNSDVWSGIWETISSSKSNDLINWIPDQINETSSELKKLSKKYFFMIFFPVKAEIPYFSGLTLGGPRYWFRPRRLWCFWALFDENKSRICSKLTLRASNIPGKHSDVAQRYQGFPNYSSHKYSAWSNKSKWENSKQALEITTNYFNFR